MTDRVPFLDLGAVYHELRAELDEAVLRVTRSGHYLLGDELDAFESEFAAYVGARHCIGLANGLDALVLSLRAMGIGPGHEVLVPSNTFIATWLAVTGVGATPIPVEPDPGTYNMDPARLAERRTAKTRAIVPVHLYGQPAAMDEMRAFAAHHGLALLEDAAQAHGARYRGTRIGGLGTTATWSFYPGKNLGAFGDGGAVTTDDDVIAARLRALRNYGSRVKYVHEIAGVNSRLDEVQAAVLRVKLKHLDTWNARRARVAARYSAELSSAGLILPVVLEGVESCWHLYVVRTARRDALRAALEAEGIGTLIHYPLAPHLQGAYTHHGYRTGDYPEAERLQSEVVSLPMGPHLSDAHQSRVIDALRRFGADQGTPHEPRPGARLASAR